MAILTVLTFPDPRLRKKAELITEIDDNLKKMVDDMFETMYHYHGVGLAATQVGIEKRVVVMDVSEDHNERICAINPEILTREGSELFMEGCLSYPGVYDKVERAAKVRFKALDIHGNSFEREAQGLLAECIQHEIDHLNGILFVEHLSRMKQDRARRKLEKFRRQAQ